MPKAELHVHLEGSIDAAALCEIDSSLAREEADAGYRYDDFAGFLRSFGFVASRLKRPEHYALAAHRMFSQLAAQGVTDAEVTLSAGVVLWKGQNLAAVFDAVAREGREAAIDVRWNLDAVRQWGPLAAWPVVEFAASRVREGVVSFGLGGNEEAGPVGWFREHYEYARKHGLRLTCHAGEADGPASIWASLEVGAERIGHGFRAIEDPVLVRHLRDHEIPLEISVTSNLLTRTVASLEDHPVRRLYDAGVPLVINTDDPALFRVTLISEYELLMREFGFSRGEIEGLVRNGFIYGFREMSTW
jgi:adenosine deaminase/aminodeoxyfutalosine deaminase